MDTKLNCAELIRMGLGCYNGLDFRLEQERKLRAVSAAEALRAHFNQKNATKARYEAHVAHLAKMGARKQEREQLHNI